MVIPPLLPSVPGDGDVDHAVTTDLVGRDVGAFDPALYYALVYADPIGELAPVHKDGPVELFNAFG